MAIITIRSRRRRNEVLEMLRHTLPGVAHAARGDTQIDTPATRAQLIEAFALRDLEIDGIA